MERIPPEIYQNIVRSLHNEADQAVLRRVDRYARDNMDQVTKDECKQQLPVRHEEFCEHRSKEEYQNRCKSAGVCDLVEYGKNARGFRRKFIGDGKIVVMDAAFANNDRLGEVVVPSSIVSIGGEAFDGSTIKKLVFQNPARSKLQTIGDAAFSHCDQLSEVAPPPSSLRKIGGGAFFNCMLLAEIDLSRCTLLVKIPRACFNECNNLRTIQFPASIEEIDDLACNECKNLVNLVGIEDSSLHTIGHGAFCKCMGLEGVSLPSSVKFIQDRAFDECGNLVAIKLPDSADIDIGQNAFRKTRIGRNKFSEEEIPFLFGED